MNVKLILYIFSHITLAVGNDSYWHCPHSMRNRVYETVRCPFLFLSIRLSQHEPTTANPLLQVCCCGPGGRRYEYRSIAAAAACGGRMRALSRCQRTWAAEHRFFYREKTRSLKEWDNRSLEHRSSTPTSRKVKIRLILVASKEF